MQWTPKTVVIRHRKENLKKCSLRMLEMRDDMQFLTYPFESLPPLDSYVILVMENAPLLSKADSNKGILLLDSTWAYLPRMVEAVDLACPNLEKRTLPGNFKTAYPRNQKDCVDPNRGLSSLEALYIAYLQLGRETHSLLDHYYWKDRFIELNSF